MGKFYRTYEGLSYDDVLLVPRHNLIESRLDTDLTVRWYHHSRFKEESPNKLFQYHKYPVMSASMDTVTDQAMAAALGLNDCMGVIHRYQSLADRAKKAVSVPQGQVGIAIGLNDDIQEIFDSVPANILLSVDVAHGHSKAVMDYVAKLRAKLRYHQIMVGNIVTKEAAIDLARLDIDYIKVGIGSSRICSTRDVTGCGFPMVSAIMEVKEALTSSPTFRMTKKTPPMIVADGGIRNSGDIAKALAAGANMVMIGTLFAGTDEAPGTVWADKQGKFFKDFSGMASKTAQDNRGGLKPGTVAEGVTIAVPYKGAVGPIVQDLIAGLRSALTYQGAKNLHEFYETSQFIKVSPMVLTAETKVG